MNAIPALATPVCEIIVAEQVETIDRSIDQMETIDRSIEQMGHKKLVQSSQNTFPDKKRNRDDTCCFVYLYFLCQSETIQESLSCCSNTSQCLGQCCFETIRNMDCDCDD